jgi:hypothetical protein
MTPEISAGLTPIRRGENPGLGSQPKLHRSWNAGLTMTSDSRVASVTMWIFGEGAEN